MVGQEEAFGIIQVRDSGNQGESSIDDRTGQAQDACVLNARLTGPVIDCRWEGE